jgi:hypothetical protein
MKRDVLGGGQLLAATLIVASSLYAGSAVFADGTSTVALQLDSVCVNAATNQAVFTAQNKNPYPIQVNWTNLDDGQSGTASAAADPNSGSTGGVFTNFATYYDASDPNNTTSFTADGWSSPTVSNAQVSVQCDTATLASLPMNGAGSGSTGGGSGSLGAGSGSTGAGSGSTGTTAGSGSTGPTNTSVGKGGGATGTITVAPVVATPPAVTVPVLADTGASVVLPYSIAMLLTVATLGTSLAVRKNLI